MANGSAATTGCILRPGVCPGRLAGCHGRDGQTGRVPLLFLPTGSVLRSLEVLSFPPDDWVMEKKMNGDRVLILSQGPSGLHLQTTPYDQRRKALNARIALLSSSKIAQVQVAMSDFPQTYNLWKDEAEVEGVVFKERSSGYPYGAHVSPEVSFWRKRRFSWDK